MDVKQTCSNTGKQVTVENVKDAEVEDWGVDAFWWECPLCQGWHLAIRCFESGLEEMDVPANTMSEEHVELAPDLKVLKQDGGGNPDDLTDGKRVDGGCSNTILVIDDEDDICTALTRLLRIEGYQVCAARNGQEGLALARRSNPHLVFVDLSLPDVSGWDVVKTIKSANKGVKVILMTGWVSHITGAEADERSVDFILCKPFDFDDVLDAMACLSAQE